MCSSLADRVASNFGQRTSICLPRLCNIAQFPRTLAPIPERPRGPIKIRCNNRRAMAQMCYIEKWKLADVLNSAIELHISKALVRSTYSGAFQDAGQQYSGEPMSRQILSGWKEISNHIERGVRTAQRWESLLGMPVHRPALKNRSAVVAFSDELESWLSRTSPQARDECLAVNDKEENNENLLRVLDDMSTLVRQSRQLICHMRVLQERRRQSRKIHRQRIASRARMRTALTAGRGRASLLIFPRRKRGWAGRRPPNAALPVADAAFTAPASLEKAR
jgi:hypothetical protein